MDSVRQQAAIRIGRRIGAGTFAFLMALFVVICSAQILRQGFLSPVVESAPGCRKAIHQLIGEIRSARAAAAVEVLGERAAMNRFRYALSWERTACKSLERQCQSDPWAKDALLAIDEWRWAEENAVRYESVDLAPSRRRIHAIELRLGLQSPGL
jgi:hypothetical protein